MEVIQATQLVGFNMQLTSWVTLTGILPLSVGAEITFSDLVRIKIVVIAAGRVAENIEIGVFQAIGSICTAWDKYEVKQSYYSCLYEDHNESSIVTHCPCFCVPGIPTQSLFLSFQHKSGPGCHLANRLAAPCWTISVGCLALSGQSHRSSESGLSHSQDAGSSSFGRKKKKSIKQNTFLRTTWCLPDAGPSHMIILVGLDTVFTNHHLDLAHVVAGVVDTMGSGEDPLAGNDGATTEGDVSTHTTILKYKPYLPWVLIGASVVSSDNAVVNWRLATLTCYTIYKNNLNENNNSLASWHSDSSWRLFSICWNSFPCLKISHFWQYDALNLAFSGKTSFAIAILL